MPRMGGRALLMRKSTWPHSAITVSAKRRSVASSATSPVKPAPGCLSMTQTRAPFLAELPGDAPADALRAAGDDGYLILKHALSSMGVFLPYSPSPARFPAGCGKKLDGRGEKGYDESRSVAQPARKRLFCIMNAMFLLADPPLEAFLPTTPLRWLEAGVADDALAERTRLSATMSQTCCGRWKRATPGPGKPIGRWSEVETGADRAHPRAAHRRGRGVDRGQRHARPRPTFHAPFWL